MILYQSPTLNRLNVLLVLLVSLTTVPAAFSAVIDPVRTWNEIALDTVRQKAASDAQAARLYAMVNIAMYDAVNGIESRHDKKDNRAAALVDGSQAPPDGDMFAAAVAAAHAVLSGVYPDRASIFDAQLQSDLTALGKGGKIKKGREWGASVGAQVLAARENDGSSPNETQPGSPPGTVGQYRDNWNGAQFRNLMPFGIADSSIYIGSGPAPLTSLDYAAAFNNVKLLGNRLNTDPEKLSIFQFWALGGGSSQPPGAWIQVALAVTQGQPLEVTDSTRLFALLTMAMADTVAPTFATKFAFHHWRPATAIHEADADGNPLTDQDAGWTQRASNIGTSPEYWSGHSSFSAAAATVLAGFFCNDNIPFSLNLPAADAAGGPTRSYSSFSDAAAEAGISRIYGGLHFPFSNEDGLEAGRAVAREILASKLLLLKGQTHFGQCPL